MAAAWSIASLLRAKASFCTARRKKKSQRWPWTAKATSMPRESAKSVPAQHHRPQAPSTTLYDGTDPCVNPGPQTPGMTADSTPSTLDRRPSRLPGRSQRRLRCLPHRQSTAHHPASGPLMTTSSMRWLSIRMAQLLAGTGNRGHVFAIDGPDDFSDLLKAPASQVTGFRQGSRRRALRRQQQSRQDFRAWPRPGEARFLRKRCFRCQDFLALGTRRFPRHGNVDLLARSGNVDNPDRNWSPWKQVDLSKDAEMGVPRRATRSGKPCCTPEARALRSTLSL